ncbi:amidohydrolase family protein [Roseivirga sp. BDSF3-8]|uniref:amidohydrolase family protein n=1 Tax=Roseivirga sp. BDSF3-8 TaxID=3241598 RepID=UPI0035320F59
MTKFYSAVVLMILAVAPVAFAQVPAPAPPQSKPILLLNGTAHIGNGEVIENSAIVFENGELTLIADARNIRLNPEDFETFSIEGKHVYPGIVLPATDLGLQEISAVRATVDNDEVGALNPNVRSIIAYNTDSEIIPTMRFNGILTAQTTPKGGLISGTSSIVQLDAWNWEDAVMKMDDAMHVQWPRYFSISGWWTGKIEIKKNEKYEEQVEMLRTYLTEASAYAKMENRESDNLKLEAAKGLFDGSKSLFLHAEYMKEIVESVTLAKELGVQNIVVAGADEAWKVKDFLKDNDVSVLISNVHRLPSVPEQDINMPYKLPALLAKEGINVGLMFSGDMLQNARNLPFFAGTVAAHGMDKEEALKLITSNNAKILGIDDRLGTLEVGKDATLVVSGGDLLDMRTSDVQVAFIQGRKVPLEAMQQRLYKKYKEKYSSQNKGAGDAGSENMNEGDK